MKYSNFNSFLHPQKLQILLKLTEYSITKTNNLLLHHHESNLKALIQIINRLFSLYRVDTID